MVQHPEVLWAQRSSDTDEDKNTLFVTVNLPDIIESSLEYNLTPTSISFKAKAGSEHREFAFDLDFFAQVDPQLSTKRLNSRSLNLVIRKKAKQSEYWPRLTKEKVKNAFLKTDFSKWVDEDEQGAVDIVAEEPEPDMGGMGMGGLPGGMGGPGGMDFEAMMKQMNASGSGGLGGMPDFGAGPSGSGAPDDGDDDDSDDDGPPPLEDAEPPK